jgi:hypothetical protein
MADDSSNAKRKRYLNGNYLYQLLVSLLLLLPVYADVIEVKEKEAKIRLL